LLQVVEHASFETFTAVMFQIFSVKTWNFTACPTTTLNSVTTQKTIFRMKKDAAWNLKHWCPTTTIQVSQPRRPRL